MPKIKTKLGFNSPWLRQRELGIRFPLGHGDQFHKALYSSIRPVTSWDDADNLSAATHGGVFNLEYSPDGSLLLAACEKKSILMFDPLRRRLIHAIHNAHNDCVNCVRFLDQRMFATCSDDSTVALWDARNLKHRIRTLQGHSNWVKNIEYSPKDSLLLTSGFDGSIYTWDINSFTENSILYTRVFQTNGLMRTRLTPDASKMLISTTSGYLIIIHNLKLSTLTQDLAGFKPNMYRLMQSSQTTIPDVVSFTHLFSHTRTHNRVEFLTDFPAGDDAEIISSLQVHPQGWCALSRNVSNGENSEWTCVHDIQERDMSSIQDQITDSEVSTPQFNEMIVEEFEDFQQPQPSRSFPMESPTNRTRQTQATNDTRSNSLTSTDNPRPVRPTAAWSWMSFMNRMEGSLREFRDPRVDRDPRVERDPMARFGVTGLGSSAGASDYSASRDESRQEAEYVNTNDNNDNMRDDPPGERDREREEDLRPASTLSQLSDLRSRNMIDNLSASSIALHVSTTDVWEAHVAIREARQRRERDRAYYLDRGWSRSNSRVSVNIPRSSHTVVIIGDGGGTPSRYRQAQQTMYAIPRNHKIHQNIPRLTHYIEEPNVGSGYIKELCFSADGRLICSPFGFGVRLLAFSSDCSELSNCVPPADKSVQLHELAVSASHSGIVVSTKFSPRHCLLVSGCLDGRIVWHQPVV